MGATFDPRMIKPLIPVLQDSNSGVRKAAVEALGEFSERRVIQPLINSVKDSDSRVRDKAEEVLGWSRDPRAVTAIQEYKEAQKVAPSSALLPIWPSWFEPNAPPGSRSIRCLMPPGFHLLTSSLLKEGDRCHRS